MLGFVTGLIAEAKVLQRYSVRVRVGGGSTEGARQAAEALADEMGTVGLVSFGLAGGLDPSLKAGTLIIPDTVLDVDGTAYRCDMSLSEQFGGPTVSSLLGGGEVAATVAQKYKLFTSTRASAIDLESAAVARVAAVRGLRFAVMRAVADPATRDLPRASLVALDGDGRISPGAICNSLLRHPLQLRSLIALGREASHARKTLQTAFEGYRRRVTSTGT